MIRIYCSAENPDGEIELVGEFNLDTGEVKYTTDDRKEIVEISFHSLDHELVLYLVKCRLKYRDVYRISNFVLNVAEFDESE